MDRVSQDLPDLVWIDKMNVSGGRVTINGRVLNPNAIANFVDNIKNDPYFEEPELGAVNEVTPVPLVYGFDMSFGFSYAPKGTAPATPGAPGTTTAAGAAPAAGAGGRRDGDHSQRQAWYVAFAVGRCWRVPFSTSCTRRS